MLLENQRRVGLLLLLAVCVAWPAVAQPPSEGESGWQELERRVGDGEQCLVCRQPIHGSEILEIRYKGRTFHVAAKMLDEFQQDPDRYFDALQARSALFDERALEGRRVSWGWVALGAYVLVGLVLAAVCGFVAIRRSLAPLPWFFAGLAGNVAALAVLMMTPRGDPARAGPMLHRPVPCPACGVSNHPSATACAGCGAGLTPQLESEVARAVAPVGGAS